MNLNDTTDTAHSGETAENPSMYGATEAAFRRAMIGVQTRARQLMTSIHDHDFEGVEHIASDAASLWLTGCVAYRRLVERTPATSPLADAARRLLEENHTVLVELFARAIDTIAVPRMQRALHDLRGTLAAAMAQPRSAGAGINTSRVLGSVP